jgi:hypothetical protein
MSRDAPIGGQGNAEAAKKHSGGRSKRGLRIGAIIAAVSTLVGLATGVLDLGDRLFSDAEESPTPQGAPEQREIPRFRGLAGHLEQSRALLDFLDQHDREVVYLDVGFPDLLTGPSGGKNVVSESLSVEGGGTRYVVTWLQLMTECDTNPPPGGDNPTVTDGCMGSALSISGPQNDDADTFFEHGVPRIKGNFAVDVTGALQMGISPIELKPLTFQQARSRL